MDNLKKALTPLSSEEAAQRLLGAKIIRTFDDGRQVVAKIVEVEAYDQDDPASHTYIGPTVRNGAMFGPAGHAYIYSSYGIHWCFNVTASQQDFGAGVLVRAVEPVQGLDIMQALRPGMVGVSVTNGPGKLTRALGVDHSFSHHDLSIPPLEVRLAKPLPKRDIVQTTRIGITKAADVLRRYYIKDSPFVSKP